MTAALGRTPPVAVTTLPLPGGDQAAPPPEDFAQLLAKAAGEPACVDVPEADPKPAGEDDPVDAPGPGAAGAAGAAGAVGAAGAAGAAGVPAPVPVPPPPTQWSPPPGNHDHNVGGVGAARPSVPTSGVPWSPSGPAGDHDAPDVTGQSVDVRQAFALPVALPAPTSTPASPVHVSPVHTHPVTQPALTGAVSRLRSAPDGVHQVEVMLHPADLGTVQVTVRLQHGALDVTVACADDASRQAVAAALPALHRDLRDVTTSSVVLTDPRPDPRSDAGPDTGPDTNDRRRHPEHGPDRHRPERHHPTPDGDFAVESWM